MEKKFKMPAKEFRDYLESVKLINISLRECKAKYNGDISLSKKHNISIKDSKTYEKKDNYYEILQKYVLTNKNGKKKIFEISATFCVIIESNKNLPDDFFEIYNTMSLPFNTWPFMREFANSITSRMNIPPLTLPLLIRQ